MDSLNAPPPDGSRGYKRRRDGCEQPSLRENQFGNGSQKPMPMWTPGAYP